MIKFIIKIILFIPCIGLANAQFTSERTRGSFSASLPISYLATGIMNSDGTTAKYKGYLYGLGLDVSLYNFKPGEVRIFGTYLMGEASGGNSAEKLKRNETFFGLKFYPDSWLFLAAGLGQSENRVSRENVGNINLNSKISGFGTGIEFNLTEAWFISLGAWYKSGAIKQDTASNINYNSNVETFEVQLHFIWSPASTIFNISSRPSSRLR